jgi:uncharacterized protein with von Willebrand factor type A (vWA) domain
MSESMAAAERIANPVVLLRSARLAADRRDHHTHLRRSFSRSRSRGNASLRPKALHLACIRCDVP